MQNATMTPATMTLAEPTLPDEASYAVPGNAAVDDAAPIDLLSPLLQSRLQAPRITGMVVGELLAITGDGLVPLVRYPGQEGSAAIAAGSTVDLQGHHIGQPVTLMFDQGDPSKPIVMGVLRGAAGWPLPQQPATVTVDEEGERLIVSAREQLVLRCGKASITLTRAGKVLIDGSYVLSRSTGVNRVKGGSVQLN
jgi:hypothetical protein